MLSLTEVKRNQAAQLLQRQGTMSKMVYISNGQMDSQSQPRWRLSLITHFFWGTAEFVVLFFKTLLQQDVKKKRS